MEKCLQSTEFLREKPFIQLPKSINSMDMSSDAKLLYANLADLLKISELNNHRDERGLYVFCSLEYIQQVLGCSQSKAVRILKELERNNLLRRRRMGQGKSNRYYLYVPVKTETEEKVQNCQNECSESQNYQIDCSRTFNMSDLEHLFQMNQFSQNEPLIKTIQ